MNLKDLDTLRDNAIISFNKKPMGMKLPGMKQPMTMEEVRVLSIYESAVQLLNKKGAIKPGWLEENPIQFLEDDSAPAEADYT